MRLAITGATGFVGSHLVDAALTAGHEVAALTRRDQPPREGVIWIPGDLHDTRALEGLVSGTDAVIHVAGVISGHNATAFEKGNVEEVVYVGMSTRYVVRLDRGEQLVAVRQNMDAVGDAEKFEGKPVQLAWTPDHTFVLDKRR